MADQRTRAAWEAATLYLSSLPTLLCRRRVYQPCSSASRDPWPTFWITGIFGSGEQTDSESWAMITWAWRSLYACTTKTHLEGVKLDL